MGGVLVLSLLVYIILAQLLQHKTAGSAFSFSQSYTQAFDAVPTSAATVGANPNFSSITSYTAGTAGYFGRYCNECRYMTVTAGGAGSSATGQFVSEITVID